MIKEKEKIMRILAHRGYWKSEGEKNTLGAFERAFRHGYGIETDVRDYRGELVVSHNVADESCPLFESVLKLYRDTGSDEYLAINIKADALQDRLKEILLKYKIEKYFVFDMSVPELVVYRAENINYFTRMSEYETEPVLLGDAAGIWMDEWESAWISKDIINQFLNKNKIVAVISPEIHKRDEMVMWNFIRSIHSDRLLLCTDKPDLFAEFSSCSQHSI